MRWHLHHEVGTNHSRKDKILTAHAYAIWLDTAAYTIGVGGNPTDKSMIMVSGSGSRRDRERSSLGEMVYFFLFFFLSSFPPEQCLYSTCYFLCWMDKQYSCPVPVPSLFRKSDVPSILHILYPEYRSLVLEYLGSNISIDTRYEIRCQHYYCATSIGSVSRAPGLAVSHLNTSGPFRPH